MTDLLIRDVPDDVIAAIDATAKRLGLSRTEYVRRQLAAATTTGQPVTIDDLTRFASTFALLDDPEAMRDAWQ